MDDKQYNVDAARAVGFEAELFVDGQTLRNQLRDRGINLRP